MWFCHYGCRLCELSRAPLPCLESMQLQCEGHRGNRASIARSRSKETLRICLKRSQMRMCLSLDSHFIQIAVQFMRSCRSAWCAQQHTKLYYKLSRKHIHNTHKHTHTMDDHHTTHICCVRRWRAICILHLYRSVVC